MDQTGRDSCMSQKSRCSKASAHVTPFPVMPIFAPPLKMMMTSAMIDGDDDDDDNAVLRG